MRVFQSRRLLTVLVAGALAAATPASLTAQDVQDSPSLGGTPATETTEPAQLSEPSSPVSETPSATEPSQAPSTPDAAAQPLDEQAPGQGTTPAATGVDAATLPHDLSPWGMFLAADIVVQAVIVGLVIASIITWTVALAKTIELWSAKRRTRRALALVSEEPSLTDAERRLGTRRGVVRAFVDGALTELRLSNDLNDKAGIKERVESRLEGIQVAAGRQIKTGTGLLATIGATAPFVGLFGTVWGIMNSFIGISEAQTTNLAVVAPGIAEALLATALGLVAAIPAVIIYNHFSRSIAGYRILVAEAAAAVMRQLSRELDSGIHSRKRTMQRAAE